LRRATHAALKIVSIERRRRVAGHRSMSTTNTYLHLAGVVLRDEADALEQRLLGGITSTSPSELR
jgi:hypothetical protein